MNRVIEVRKGSKKAKLIKALLSENDTEINYFFHDTNYFNLIDWVAKDFGLNPNSFNNGTWGEYENAIRNAAKQNKVNFKFY